MDLAQLLNGIALGALYAIVSSGLAMIYGLRGVMNFSHGALYMVGAYVTYEIALHAGFWVAMVGAALVLAIAGAIIELSAFRGLQGRSPIEVALVMFGVALVLERVVGLVWGSQPLGVDAPAGFDGSANVLGTSYPAYRLLLIGVAATLALGLTSWLRFSRTGLYVRAVSQDRETAALMGVNIDRVSLIVVCLGAALAGIAGALAAPYLSVSPGMDTQILIPVLIVVILGGLGSVGGAMVAALLLGIFQVMGTVMVPSVAFLVPYVALVAVLLIRPSGIAGARLE